MLEVQEYTPQQQKVIFDQQCKVSTPPKGFCGICDLAIFPGEKMTKKGNHESCECEKEVGTQTQ